MRFRAISPATKGFADSEEGGLTVLSLFLFLGMLMAAGFAVDVNNMVQTRAQLQGAADAAGHAALYWKWRNTEADSISKAIEIAEDNMPTTRFGNVLATVDVEFGDWIPPTNGNPGYFQAMPNTYSAVQVTTRRARSNSNALGTFLMKFLGQDVLDVKAVSVWDREEGWCPRGEGFFAVGIVDIQSNNHYRDGFCVHSETHVEFQQNSTFDSGVVVSMPDQADLVIPQSGFSQNSGLWDALDSINYNLTTFFDNLPTLINSYNSPTSHLNASIITDTKVYNQTMKAAVTATDIVPNAVNVMKCTNKTLTIDNNVVIKDAVVITDCEVKFNQGSALENATLISTNTSTKAISGGAGVRIGASTYCNDGKGGANLISMGDISASSDFKAFGANVIAAGNINITANANGLAGINFMAGGRIDATSGGDLGFCNYGPPTPFQIPVFRMVM